MSVLAIKSFGEDACEKKRAKHEQLKEKNQKKKAKKRKRRDEEGKEGNEDGGAKFQKGNNGLAVAPSNGLEQSEATESINDAPQNHGMDLGSRDNGGVALQQDDSSEGRQQSEAINPTLPAKDEVTTNDVDNSGGAATENGKSESIWQPRFRILDALSATGLRALRYASEIPFATAIVANDRDKNAAKSIKLNVEHSKLSSKISTTNSDALGHMYAVAFPPTNSHGPQHISGKYDVIDLDPYGTAAPFFDAALQAMEDGGLLCVTCTDSGVFASCGYSEKTYSLYGGMPIKGLHSHEGGLRLVLHSIATTASKYGISIEPLLSLSIDFYVRLFIRVHRRPMDVKFLAGKTMLVYGCDHGCGAWTTQHLGRHMRHKNSKPDDDSAGAWKFTIGQGPSTDKNCEHCGSKMHIAGPMWGGPLHNPFFIERILDDLKGVDDKIYQTMPRIEGMLDTALDELLVCENDMPLRPSPISSDFIPETPAEALDHHPFFFIPSALCKVIKATAPPEILIKGALKNAGYVVTRSHCKPGSMKTDAPWTVVWEVMREWVRQRSPVKESSIREGTPGWTILQTMRKSDHEEGDLADRSREKGEVNGTAQNSESAAEGKGDSTSTKDGPTEPKRLKVVFDAELGKDKPGKRLVRYQQNPRENWGPMAKARGSG